MTAALKSKKRSSLFGALRGATTSVLVTAHGPSAGASAEAVLVARRMVGALPLPDADRRAAHMAALLDRLATQLKP